MISDYGPQMTAIATLYIVNYIDFNYTYHINEDKNKIRIRLYMIEKICIIRIYQSLVILTKFSYRGPLF